ncbi:ribokinase [Pseudonocardia ailaonensis]|uniref:Ribokinase n=1 Tax=Pseudonocardia ailaonensis TaxID=367279 RepID=A0ABN2NHX1_9PSEU
MDLDVTVVGTVNADHSLTVTALPSPGETVLAVASHRGVGGKSANQAVSAALLGAGTSLFAVVGDDAEGSALVGQVAARGVDTAGVVRAAGRRSGSAVVTVDTSGENCIVVWPGANALLESAMVPDSALGTGAIVVLSLESPVPVVEAVAERAAALGGRVLLNASPAAELPDGLWRATDVVVVNHAEATALTGVEHQEGWASLRAAFARRGVPSCIVTLGAGGAVVLEPRSITEIPAVRVDVVDTTGCGDAFMGAVAAGLARRSSLVDAARLGVVAGAWAARGAGAQASYASSEELDGWQGTTVGR